MPIYEYRCKNCGESFDFFAQRINESPGECPDCGSTDIEKKLSTFSVGGGESSSSSGSSCSTGTCPTGTCPL